MIIPSHSFGVIASGRPRVVVASGGGDVTPDPVNWTDIQYEEDGFCPGGCWEYTAQQITGISSPITLSIGWTGSPTFPGDAPYFKVYSSTPDLGTAIYYPPSYLGYTLSTNGQTFSVQPDYWVVFSTETYDDPPLTVTIRNVTDGNSVLDTYNQEFYSACLLSTVVIEYYNLQDDGPELTAMRQLREYYIGVPGYAEIIQEYYQTSPSIISAIDALADPSVEYTYIYNTVVAVMNHVNAEEWQQAHDLYMAMYNDLKDRYLG
jgi:hypothetical protein